MADKQAKDWDKTLFNLDKFLAFMPPNGTSSALVLSETILNLWIPKYPFLYK